MKHIKKYTLFERVSKETKLFESVEETKNWISEVMNTCKNIMIELEDVDIKTDVTRSLQSRFATSDLNKSILIECIIILNNSEDIVKFRKVMIDSEIKSRLIDYMESEGFELIDYSPYVKDGQFKMSFKKSDIDSDYIAHLRYLKKYNIE
jgi:hypothetical protein